MKGWLEYISFELFTEMSMSNCYYCDIEPISKIFDRKKNKDKTLISDEFVFVNGIDRINSNIGYVKENVVSCCKHCNTAKNTMNDSEFKEWIKRVYDHYVK